jgi:hypothetical protein
MVAPVGTDEISIQQNGGNHTRGGANGQLILQERRVADSPLRDDDRAKDDAVAGQAAVLAEDVEASIAGQPI